jgi:hypothetical protein
MQSSTPVRNGILGFSDDNMLRRESVMGIVMRTAAFMVEKELLFPPRIRTIVPEKAKSAGESARRPRNVVGSTEGCV